jgi:hypothetical protein
MPLQFTLSTASQSLVSTVLLELQWAEYLISIVLRNVPVQRSFLSIIFIDILFLSRL